MVDMWRMFYHIYKLYVYICNCNQLYIYIYAIAYIYIYILLASPTTYECIPDCSCLPSGCLCSSFVPLLETQSKLFTRCMPLCYMLRVHYPCQGLLKLSVPCSFGSLCFFPIEAGLIVPLAKRLNKLKPIRGPLPRITAS